MKSLLNLILIAIACNFANTATSSGLKTIPVTDKTLPTKTLPNKTTPNSSVLASTAFLPLEVQYYTTAVPSTSKNFISYYTTVLPNTVIPSGDAYGCVPAKGYTAKRIEEICTASSSITYCKPYTAFITKATTFCQVVHKTLSYTIPVTKTICYSTSEECEHKTRKFSKTILPFEDYYNNVKSNNKAQTLSLLSYEYNDCNPKTKTIECYYPDTDFNSITSTIPPTTSHDILSPVTLPPKTTTTSSVSTISNTVSLPPKTTTISKLNMNLYTTVIGYNEFTMTTIVPVDQKVSINHCSSTTLNADGILSTCVTIDRESTSCNSRMAATRITRRFCTYSTEYLDSPLAVTATNCPQKTCTKEISYTTYSSIHETISPIRTNEVCSTFDIGCVIPVTESMTATTTTTTPPITVPPKTTITSITTTTTTTTPVITDCPSVTITYTEKETVTETEKETITITVKATPTNIDDDSKCPEKYEQCGGEGYTGPTCCKNGLSCRRISRYFSHCE